MSPRRPLSAPAVVLLAVGLALPAGLLLVGGTAEAQLQDIVFELRCPEGPTTIQPLGPPGVWQCTAQLTYTSARTGMTDPTQAAIVAINVVDAPSWMNPVVSPPVIASLGPGYGNEVVSYPVVISVGLTPQAPAFETHPLTLEPEVIQHPREEGELSMFTVLSGTNLAVTPGYFSLYNIRVQGSPATGQPQEEISYTIELENFSNGPTQFSFELITEDTRGFQPVVPEPQVLAGATGRDMGVGEAGNGSEDGNATTGSPTRASIPFPVYTAFRNGYQDHRAPLQLRVDTAFAPDTSVTGTSSTLSVLAHSKGFYAPGPEAPLVVGLVVLMGALVARPGRRA